MTTSHQDLTIKITAQQRDAILGALRLYQHSLTGLDTSPDHAGIADIATNGGEHPAPSVDDIDTLCEHINVGA